MPKNQRALLNELALFAGAGGGILGGILSGFRTVCAVEISGFARNVLLARQNDGTIGPFPIWDDIRSFDGKPWRGLVDVVSGGFPCQDISIARAGFGRAGLDGSKSKLWWEMFRIIEEVQPTHVFAENSPMLRRCGLLEIIRALASIGYDARWTILGANAVGLPHIRNRLWLYAANSNSKRLEGHFWDESNQKGWEKQVGQIANARFYSCEKCGFIFSEALGLYGCPNCHHEGCGGNLDQWTGVLPRVAGMADGVACRMERIEAIGNGQVPAVAAFAWKVLSGL